jgi:(heptosyl)LPS beta-1,4-glucosyltransferase
MGKSNITVILEVYNEEDRIELCLKNFLWADQVILVDKSSTDRTVEIAKRYAIEVIIVPYSDRCGCHWKKILSERDISEWVMAPTASSLIHPNLVKDIIVLTTNFDFDYDVIGMPYAIYSFGICSNRSPWHDKRKYTLIRKSSLELTDKLHYEFYSKSKKIYDMPIKNEIDILYHLTHKNIEDYFEKVHRYTKVEAEENIKLKEAFHSILKSVYIVTLKKGTIWIWKNGFAISLLYVNYYVVRYLRVWEKNLNLNNYSDIKTMIRSEWNKESANKD